jgi:serine carboxypeptidase-like clade 2
MENNQDFFHKNEYSWNMFANVLYIESPGGVGYSTCSGDDQCNFDDNNSAADNLVAILNWYIKFPEF